MKTVLGTLIAVALIGLGLALFVIYSGLYNVAATEPHTAVGRWVFSTTMHRSVKQHAESIQAPELTARMAERGFAHYDAHCKLCHGAPGVDASHVKEGLRPQPPNLSETVGHWKPAELFWIVKHGIRMTGMPAWGPHYTDEELWDVVAFTRRLPDMDGDDYQALVQAQEAEEGDSQQQGNVVEMTDTLKFTPAEVRIEAGETVTWRNTSSLVHTVTADPSQAADSENVSLPANAQTFDSGDIEPGGSYEHRFDVPGRYTYFCIPHEAAGMVAEIVVEEAQ